MAGRWYNCCRLAILLSPDEDGLTALILPSIDWSQLWRESRPEIIGGLVVLIVGALLAAFWKRIFPSQKVVENGDPPRTVQPPPQEILVKVEPDELDHDEIIQAADRIPLVRAEVRQRIGHR